MSAGALSLTGHLLSSLGRLLSCGASELHPIAGPAEQIQNVLPYISTLIVVQQNIKIRSRHAEVEYADSQ
jgi:hypothetical protein